MTKEKKKLNWITIPNLLSVLRIVLIPVFAVYFLKGNMSMAISVLVASGLTDCCDGFIARHFNQITEIGKILDPLADKLTQGIVAICVAVKIPETRVFLILFLVKEVAMLICGMYLVVHKKKKPGASKWYGKVATFMFYVSIGAIFLMEILGTPQNMFALTANILLGITCLMMIFSGVMYLRIYFGKLRSESHEDDINIRQEFKTRI
ncbi:MAG: CDP-alcohol phosphatidyltransferase family protein [Clostridia bacterium]|nr:CDP-alcohol phosphatidyltransferase family protein [Clostridia bacterium]